MKKLLVFLWAMLLLCWSASIVYGMTITDPNQLSPGWELIDFEEFDTTEWYIVNQLVVGDVTFSHPETLWIRDISSYPANGTEVETKVLETYPDYLPLTISFENPVSEVLLGWLDPNFTGNYLKAFDSGNQLLEEMEITDLGPTGNVHATWIGFKRPAADIAKVFVVPPSGLWDNYMIDNIHYNTNPSSTSVPDASVMLLLGSSLMGLAVFSRKRSE